MAGSVNKCIIIGNCGKDPEIRATQSGERIANLTVACSESWKDRNGERQERTEWIRVVVFNDRTADAVERFCKKGSKVYVEGQLQTRKWTDQQGQERYSTEVVVGKFNGQVTFLSDGSGGGDKQASDERNGGGGSRGSSGWDRPASRDSKPKGKEWGGPGGDLDDAIPF